MPESAEDFDLDDTQVEHRIEFDDTQRFEIPQDAMQPGKKSPHLDRDIVAEMVRHYPGLDIAYYDPYPSYGEPWLWLQNELGNAHKVYQEMDANELGKYLYQISSVTGGEYSFVKRRGRSAER